MPFDVDAFLALPRLSGLHVAPDGRAHVQSAVPDKSGGRFTTTVLDVGAGDPRELTGSRPGLAVVGHTPSGDLLLLDRRPGPDAKPEPDQGDPVPALWLLPAAGGEARFLAGTPAGISEVRVARDAGTVVLISDVHPGAADLDEDRAAAAARRDARATGVLFEGYPVRFWDHLLGPREPRLFVLDPDGTLRDLTGNVGQALREPSFDITPDGRTIVTAWAEPVGGADARRHLVAIDVADGTRRTLAAADDVEYLEVACGPDGRTAAVTRVPVHSPSDPIRTTLWLVDLGPDGVAPRQLAPDSELWPADLAWAPDGLAVLAAADEQGRAPAWRYPLDPGDGPAVLRLCGDGAFTDLQVVDGVAYALRSRIGTPPEVVAFDPAEPDQQAKVLHAEPVELPGRVEEITTTVADGTPLRAWLVLPTGEGPHPLAVLVHGGPLSSWNAWHWRWQPQVFAARGYAVLLPDPALSTGYGQRMVERGWDQFGGAPYDDVLALTDAALRRDDLDAERTAVLGGSYGGYLTSWIIGHTDRFRAAVSHAPVWDMRAFRPVTDETMAWERWWGDPAADAEDYRRWSPSEYADRIATPTLVVHGERDYRCPVGEGLALYTELQRRDVPSALLYLPDEGHWVLGPGNIRQWYSTVLAWLDRHVLDAPWRRPDLL